MTRIEEGPSDRAGRFSAVLFALLACTLAVRVLITESFERSQPFFLQGVPTGPTPMTTAVLDLLLLLVAGVSLAVRGARLSRGGCLAGGLLVLACVLSVCFAGDRRLALNGGTNILITLLGGWALVNLPAPRVWGLVLIPLVLAVCATDAVKCLGQYGYEFEMTRAQWEEHKQGLADSGVDVDVPQMIDYERRLQSAEAFGYQSHPNVAAALMTIGVVVGLGATVASLSGTCSSAFPVVLGLVFLLLGAGVWTTGSLAGGVSAAAGLLLFGGLYCSGASTRTIRRVLVGSYVAGFGLLLALGFARGGLPGDSLDFRWQYWRGAAGVYGEAPLTGVGRLNFGPRYLAHRPAEATEAVADPHNVWVAVLAEWGPLGLLGAVLLLWVLVSGLLRVPAVAFSEQEGETTAGGAYWWLLGGVLVGVPQLHLMFSGTSLLAPGVGLLWAVEVVAVFAGVFLLTAAGMPHLSGPRARSVLVLGIATAVWVNLVHNLIGFSLMTPGGLALLVLVSAAGLRLSRVQTARSGSFSFGVLALTVLMAALQVGLVLLPTARSERAYRSAREAQQVEQVRSAAAVLAGVDVLDPWGPRTAAGQLVTLALHPRAPRAMREELLREAERYAARSAARDERNPAALQMQARIAYELARGAGQAGDAVAQRLHLERGLGFWEMTIERNPQRARLRLEAARTAMELYRLRPTERVADLVRTWLTRALALHALRSPESTARLSEKEEAELTAMLAEVKE